MPARENGAGIYGYESAIFKNKAGVLKLLCLEDLFDMTPSTNMVTDENTGNAIKYPDELYVVDRGGEWGRVTSIIQKPRTRSIAHIRVDDCDTLILTDNYPLIISNDNEDIVPAICSREKVIHRQFRERRDYLQQYAGNIDHIEADFMAERVLDNYCYEVYSGQLQSCRALIDLDESLKVSLFGYFIGKFIITGHLQYSQRGHVNGVVLPGCKMDLACKMGKGIYDATGIACEIIPDADNTATIYSDSIAMIRLLTQELLLLEDSRNRRLPPDIFNYPRSFQLGVYLGIMNGSPEHPEIYESRYMAHGRKLSTQVTQLARGLGMPGRIAIREQAKTQYAYPLCGYFVRNSKQLHNIEVADEWNPINVAHEMDNPVLLRECNYVYEITVESGSFIMNNIWVPARR